jgi:negative regulator of flagellin synthesis FlgM
MDGIDNQVPKGVAAGLKVRGAVRVSGSPVQAQPTAAKAAQVPVSTVASAGVQPPVDQDRVTEIRRAIESGRYPVVPAKIADAMIAAGLLLRVSE